MGDLLIFQQLGTDLCRRVVTQTSPGIRRFKGLFGCEPKHCVTLWNLISRPFGARHIHLLYALLFLKVYGTEDEHSVITHVHEQTFRKWSWIFIKLIANLDVVSFINIAILGYDTLTKCQIRHERRFEGAQLGTNVFTSLDGVDFEILEQSPWDKKWFSQKFGGPGLRYEIGLCIITGNIVWAYGGFPCGETPDINLARSYYVTEIEDGELTLADDGYKDPRFIYPAKYPETQNDQKRIMKRHETVNHRVKVFQVLGSRFRHHPDKHPQCFYAVVNIVQIVIDGGDKLYDVSD